MREIHPVSLKQMLHLQFKEPGIGKYRTITAKQTVGRILEQYCIETFKDACCHGCPLRSVAQSVERAATIATIAETTRAYRK
jgi:hypothetical protein